MENKMNNINALRRIPVNKLTEIEAELVYYATSNETLTEDNAHLTVQNNIYREALESIEVYGHARGCGMGFSCANMAAEALERGGSK